MISELSAGCECRLFGTGLVMSENASDCTQNAAYRDRKLKKNFWGGGHPLPKPHPTRGLRRLDSRAFGVRRAAPPLSSSPHLKLLATGLVLWENVQTTWCELKFLLEGLERYKDTRMKAYDITKLTAAD